MNLSASTNRRWKRKMKVKKWVRTASKVLFFIGVCITFGIAGNCDAYPDYPIGKVLIYALISAICFLPYLLIFINEESEDE